MQKVYVLILYFSLYASAWSYAQSSNATITYSSNNKALIEVLKEIEQTTALRFSFNSSVISASEFITIDAYNMELQEFIHRLLSEKFDYKIFDTQIVIQPKITTQKQSSAAKNSQPTTRKLPIKPQLDNAYIDTLRVYDTITTTIFDTTRITLYDTIFVEREVQKNPVLQRLQSHGNTYSFDISFAPHVSIPLFSRMPGTEQHTLKGHAGFATHLAASMVHNSFRYAAGLQYTEHNAYNSFTTRIIDTDGTYIFLDTLWYWKYNSLFTYHKFSDTGDSVAITVYDSVYTYDLHPNPMKSQYTEKSQSHVKFSYLTIPFEFSYRLATYNKKLLIEPGVLVAIHALLYSSGTYIGAGKTTLNMRITDMKRFSYSIGMHTNFDIYMADNVSILLKPSAEFMPTIVSKNTLFTTSFLRFSLACGIRYSI